MLKKEKFYHMNEKKLPRSITEYTETNKLTFRGNGGISWGVTHRIFSQRVVVSEEWITYLESYLGSRGYGGQW